MTDHSSLLKEKNNPDIVERLEDYAEDDYYFDHKGSLVTTNRPIALREASAEITRLREDNKKLSDKAEALRKALVLVMDYPDVRKYLGSQVANVADAAIAATKEQQADERGDMAMREWHRECDDADTILRALGLDPVNCRTDGGSLKTGMILDALQARDRMLQRSAPAAPSSCGWTDCKNMPKCECCKVWDSMGI